MGAVSKDSLQQKTSTMKLLVPCILLIAAVLEPALGQWHSNRNQGFFTGPSAVGVGLGVVSYRRGSSYGAYLGKRRTYSSGGYSYNRYSNSNHYQQSNNYYRHYTRPKTTYYSSRRYNSYRLKRDIFDYSEEELDRVAREVSDSTLTDEWYMDMVEKDQDDCTKRLICEVSHKKASGQSMNSVEEDIIAVFGEGTAVDTSKSTAVFDFAVQAGKYWKVGGIGCDFFRRCDTPHDDMVAMIENELDDFMELEKSFKGNKNKITTTMSEEHDSIEKEMKDKDLM